MALLITDDCIACGACPAVCPNDAIIEADPVFIINGERCTECVGAKDEPQCVTVCPVDCIKPDPKWKETPEQLQAKYAALHG